MTPEALGALLRSGSAVELKHHMEQEEAKVLPEYLRSSEYQALFRKAATSAAAAGNMEAVRYLCGERGVPVNFVPPDELGLLDANKMSTPLFLALHNGHEDIVVYLLSRPRGEDSPPLHLNQRYGPLNAPLLTLAAEAGKARVVEALLNHDVDLLARDEKGHLAVCRAAIHCHVRVMDILLTARRGECRTCLPHRHSGCAGLSMPARQK